MDIRLAILLAISALTLLSAAVVAFSRNIIYSAFSLLGVFVGVFGLYILLSADFVAITQLIVYVGGVLILIIFAVMLTTKIDLASGQRKLLNKAMEPLAAFFVVAVLGILIWREIDRVNWPARLSESFVPTTAMIGNELLQRYLLPFEVASLLLVLVLVGAVLLARREVK